MGNTIDGNIDIPSVSSSSSSSSPHYSNNNSNKLTIRDYQQQLPHYMQTHQTTMMTPLNESDTENNVDINEIEKRVNDAVVSIFLFINIICLAFSTLLN